MQQIIPFRFGPEEKQVRVILIDDQPWWVAMSRLDEDEGGVSVMPTPSGSQEMNIVNESGLYNLIFPERNNPA